MSVIKKILALLTPQERRRGCLLLFMILAMAMLDTIGVASIMPFMAVLGNPDIVETNRWLNLAYVHLGFSDPRRFLFFLGITVFFFLIASIATRGLIQWALLRFTYMRNFSVSCRLFQDYLGRPYIWFLNRHSAELGKFVLSEVGQVITGVLIPGMQLIAHGTVALFLIVLLVLMDPLMAFTMALVLGGAYALIFLLIRKYLSRIGTDRELADRKRFQVAQEALGSIKEVKIFSRENSFYSRLINPAFRVARHQASGAIAAQIPRFLMEIVAFGGILTITLYLFKTYGNFSKVLPVLAVYAFAGYRLLPSLQAVYNHLSMIRFYLPALDVLYRDIQECGENDQIITDSLPAPMVPRKAITLQDISFVYPGAEKPALADLSLEIPALSTVGLVGATGSGKTTTVDIILGLLAPRSGQLFVDGKPIFDGASFSMKIRAWQRALGYVPQHINLTDDTVAANIAFGIPAEEIDMQAVEQAARIANLHGFITEEMPRGYRTMVGERGVRLSGGQRQRIGIARALYHDPAVLVFDEATSALDNITEQAVMQAINNLNKAKTIILIAHRLTTVKDCDCIFMLDHGRLIGRGTYDELIKTSAEFQRLVEVFE